MRILFVLAGTTLLRHFESPILALAARGQQVRIATPPDKEQVAALIRPAGWNRPATPLLADAIEQRRVPRPSVARRLLGRTGVLSSES